MKKLLMLLAVSGFVASGQGLAQSGDLVQVTDIENLAPYFEREDLDFGDYSSVLIAPLSVADARVLPPPWVTGKDASPKKWKLTASDVKWLRESYQSAMREQISGDGGYPIVEQPEEGTLIIRVELVSLMPFARKGERVETQGFGVIVAQVQLRDGMSGDLLAIYEGPQRVGTEFQANTRLNAENRLIEIFTIWGKRLRNYMEAES